MTGLETHPTLAEYRLAELQRMQERRARRAYVLRTLGPEQARRGGSLVVRALPMRVRHALRV